mgnify:CR=1 FL=1
MKDNSAQRDRVNAVKEALRQPLTWPGAYPKTFIAYDGPLCHECVRADFKAVLQDTRANVGPWNLRVDVLWEGDHFCNDCGTQLETAYGELAGCEE